MQQEIALKPIDGALSTSQATVVTRRGQKLPQYLATITANIPSYAYGVGVGWPSAAIPQLMSEKSPIGSDPISTEDGSWLGSLICLGALAALPIYSYISERFGRKIAGYLVSIPFLIGWILIYSASSVLTLFIARFFIGLSSGGFIIVTPVYVGEIAEDSVRGTLGSFFLLFINLGIFSSYVIGAYVSFHGYAIFGFVLPIAYLLAFYWLPETPVFLITKDKQADALNSLKWLRGSDAQLVEEEFESMVRTVKESKENSSASVSLKDLYATRGARMGVIIGVVLCTSQQLCGIFAIASYTGSIFAESGSTLDSSLATIIFGALQVIGSFTSSFLMDRAGRKILIILSQALMFVCLLAIGVYFYLKKIEADTSSLNWLPVTSLSVYILAFALGMGPVPFLMISEVTSPHIRGIVSWMSTTTLWLLAFLVAKFFGTISEALGIYMCFWAFAVFCIAGIIFDVFILPETKNKSLETILKELNKENRRDGQGFTNNSFLS